MVQLLKGLGTSGSRLHRRLVYKLFSVEGYLPASGTSEIFGFYTAWYIFEATKRSV